MSVKSRRGALIPLLLSGTGVLAICTAALATQESLLGRPANDETVIFSADQVIRKGMSEKIFAEGNVNAFFGKQSLLADEVTYDAEKDIVTARGNVSIFDGDGQTYYADEVELTGDLRDGVASNFSAILGKQSRLAGSTVVRRSDGTNDINNAAYTACAVCQNDGSHKTPTWSVRATKVTQDTEDKMIRFRNATVNVLGVPVAYTPYLAFPDPSVKRKSGFLAPSIATSSRLGFEAEVPYYFAISDHQDLTLAPRIFTELGTLAQGEYRIRRHDSGAVIQAGFIDPSGVTEDDDTEGLRWHFFAKAFRELDNGWRADIDFDYVSDKKYLRTYDVEPEGDLREAIDFLQPDRLENVISFSKLTANSYTDVSTVLFQSLRGNEKNDFMADALPRFRHERRMAVPRIGGEATFSGDFLYLHRPSGLDSARMSGSVAYEKAHTTKSGHRLRGFAEVRSDYYRYTDADQGNQACNIELSAARYEACRSDVTGTNRKASFSTTRVLPTAGIEWSYPLAKFTADATFIIVPRVQLVISPDEDFLGKVINEDSQAFQFDSANLFDWNKSTGLDQWEDGQRLNVGAAAQANYENGLSIKGSLGQQFRASNSTSFDPDTGLGERSSDYVGELDVAFGRRLSIENSFRFDDGDLTLRRGETTLRARTGPLATSISYLRVEDQTASVRGQRDEFVTAAAIYKLSNKWFVGGTLRENLAAGQTTNRSLNLRYRDDCTIFSMNYRFDDARGDNRSNNTSLTFNVELSGL